MSFSRILRPGAAILVLAVTTLALAGEAYAQTATLSGFVTDRTDGRPLEGASVALYHPSDERTEAPAYGTATDGDGLYLISRIQPGRYVLEISFVGYRAFRDTLSLAAGEVHTASVALVPVPEALQEVLVESERIRGAADITAGQQTIHPAEIERIPAPGLSADLASYLTEGRS